MLGCQGLGHGGVPHGVLLAEGVAEDEELAQAGSERDFGWLAGREQALVRGPEARMVADRCQRSHVERGADPGAATPDAPAPAPGAAVAVEGGHADQGGDLPAGAAPEFGQLREQGSGGHRADAGDALQPGGAGAQGGLGLHEGRQIPVRLLDQAGHHGQECVAAGQLRGLQVAALLLLGDARLDQLVPAAAKGLQPPLHLRGLGAQWGPHLRREARQPAGIQPIGLGQGAVGASEVADLARIDHDHRQARQARHHGPLVAAGRFQHDAGRPPGRQPAPQAAQAAARARTRPGVARGLHRHVHLGLRHIDPHRHLGVPSHWVPSDDAGDTPRLADAGSR